MNVIEQIENDLGALRTEENRELIAAILADVSALSARRLLGEDVDAELLHVKSQTASLGGAVQVKLEASIETRFTRLISRLVLGVFAA